MDSATYFKDQETGESDKVDDDSSQRVDQERFAT